jgi:hypothetical protein
MKLHNLLPTLVLAAFCLVGCSQSTQPQATTSSSKVLGTNLTWEEQQETWNEYKQSMHDVVALTKSPADAATEQFILANGKFVDDRVGPRPVLDKGFYILVINGDALAQTEWERKWALESQNFASFTHPDNVLVIKRGGLPISPKLKGTMLLHEGSHAQRNLIKSYAKEDRKAFLNDELLAYKQQIPEVRAIYGKGYLNLRARVLNVARARVKINPELKLEDFAEIVKAFMGEAVFKETAAAFSLSNQADFDEVGIPFQFLAYDCIFQALEESSKTPQEATDRQCTFLGSIYPDRG